MQTAHQTVCTSYKIYTTSRKTRTVPVYHLSSEF